MKILFRIKDKRPSFFIIRVLIVLAIVYLITVIQENTLVIGILIALLSIWFLLNGKNDIIITESYIQIASNSLVQFWKKKKITYFKDLEYATYFKSYIGPELDIPIGVFGVFKPKFNHYMVLKYKDGSEKNIYKLGREEEFLEAINIINTQIKNMQKGPAANTN
jgi:hypothetical protein